MGFAINPTRCHWHHSGESQKCQLSAARHCCGRNARKQGVLGRLAWGMPISWRSNVTGWPDPSATKGWANAGPTAAAVGPASGQLLQFIGHLKPHEGQTNMKITSDGDTWKPLPCLSFITTPTSRELAVSSNHSPTKSAIPGRILSGLPDNDFRCAHR